MYKNIISSIIDPIGGFYCYGETAIIPLWI